MSWESTAEKVGEDTWKYERKIRNQGTKRCAIDWKVGSTSSTALLEPANENDKPITISGHEFDISPKDEEGSLLYNGGSSDGEKSADAPVWFPRGTASPKKDRHKSTSTAYMSFKVDDKHICKGTVIATCEVNRIEGGTRIKYEVSSDIDWSDVGITNTDRIRIKWKSLDLEQINKKDTLALDGRNVELKDSSFGVGSRSRWLDCTVKTEREIYVHNGTIIIQDKDGKVLAESWLPVYAPGTDYFKRDSQKHK